MKLIIVLGICLFSQLTSAALTTIYFEATVASLYDRGSEFEKMGLNEGTSFHGFLTYNDNVTNLASNTGNYDVFYLENFYSSLLGDADFARAQATDEVGTRVGVTDAYSLSGTYRNLPGLSHVGLGFNYYNQFLNRSQVGLGLGHRFIKPPSLDGTLYTSTLNYSSSDRTQYGNANLDIQFSYEDEFSTEVSEPGAIALILLGALGLLRKKRRSV